MGTHGFPDGGRSCGLWLFDMAGIPMNHAEHSKALQAEIVNYRLVLDSIRTLCRFGSPIQPGPLMNLCTKALDEPAGAVIAKEYSLLRLLEIFDRNIIQALEAPLDVKVDLDGLLKKKVDCLAELVKLRTEAEARAKIILPNQGIVRG